MPSLNWYLVTARLNSENHVPEDEKAQRSRQGPAGFFTLWESLSVLLDRHSFSPAIPSALRARASWLGKSRDGFWLRRLFVTGRTHSLQSHRRGTPSPTPWLARIDAARVNRAGLLFHRSDSVLFFQAPASTRNHSVIASNALKQITSPGSRADVTGMRKGES